jgi:hypothetical protein
MNSPEVVEQLDVLENLRRSFLPAVIVSMVNQSALVGGGRETRTKKLTASRLNSAVKSLRFFIEHLLQGFVPFLGVHLTRASSRAVF